MTTERRKKLHGSIHCDSEQRNIAEDIDTSGKNTPEPEKDERKMDEDIEKQSRDQLPLQQTADAVANESKDESLVEFDGPDDPENPKNWSTKRKVAITISMGVMAFVVTFSSSVFAVTVEPVAKEFDIGTITATLGVSLFLLVNFVERLDIEACTD